MDIKGLDYNTQREKLLLPEYGREIQKMVDYAKTLGDKEERQQCALAIIQQMKTKMPQVELTGDYEQTLWDHLYLMSHKELDIDWPYDVSDAERILSKPDPLPLPNHPIHLRHYGSLVEQLFEQLKQMEPGEERDALVSKTANQMKRDLAQWGHGSISDEKVADDLARFTDGIIQIDLNNFKFSKITPVVKEGKKKKK